MPLPKTLLIVEDNPVNRLILKDFLSPHYTLLEAENGQEALHILEQYKNTISAILLDIIMPVMDGYTFLSIVKKNAEYASIPVIVTTSTDEEDAEVSALQHGATDFIAKPYRPQIILNRIASIISLRETAALVNQFRFDGLTGLYTKAFFYQRAREILMQNPDTKYDILCSDVEKFKLINDVFGTPAGDRLLCGIATLFQRLAGEDGISGHFNADQFVCLVKHQEPYTDAFFEGLCDEITAMSGARSIPTTWGVYAISDRTVSVEQMCDRALLAARSIHGHYGKHFALYDDELRERLLRERGISEEMESALKQGQFEIYLQPKYRISDSRMAGAEALVRWNHPTRGLMSPGLFIPLFEKNGFITKMDQFVWDQACAVLRSWLDEGLTPIPISVNVSRADIHNADLADILLSILHKYDVPAKLLHLEITESAYTEHPDQIIEAVRNLRELGFVIEMDDFGKGYSSLNMLSQMPMDILKLDLEFIRAETSKPLSEGILRFIMGLARWMRLRVVAEGVETEAQLARLRDVGCDYAQGYLFAKPMPVEKLNELLRKAEAASASSATPAPATSKRVLLLACADAAYRETVRSAFADQFDLVLASDADAALSRVTTEGFHLAAAMIDLTLTAANGDTMLDILTRERTAWSFPLVTLAPAEGDLEQRALAIGADDHIALPQNEAITRARVLRAIDNFVTHKRLLALSLHANEKEEVQWS